MLMNYHIGRLVLSSMGVGAFVVAVVVFVLQALKHTHLILLHLVTPVLPDRQYKS